MQMRGSPASAALPTVVARPERFHCDARDLERITPWKGTILERKPGEIVESASRTIRTEWVLCNELDEASCTSWATRVGHERADAAGLEAYIFPGRSERGKAWVVRVGDHEQTHLFRTNREFVTFFRELEKDGKDATVIASDRVVETRYGRVEISYKTAWRDEHLPSSRWHYQIDTDPQSLAEALLAFEDLETEGVELGTESWSRLRDVALHFGGGAEYKSPTIAATKARTPSDTYEVWLDVRCAVP